MKWKTNIFLVVLSVILFKLYLSRDENVENLMLKCMEEAGYISELHNVITEDGYILGLHRIIKSINNNTTKNDNKNERKRPVLIIHGLETSAIDWLYYLGKNSLPYLLYEEGHDVWLGNVRGTYSSYNHTILNPIKEPKKFWNFSFHEIGRYDLPSMIDHVLNVTKYEKLFYIGMSQGEATFLILTSTRPEYNKKIELSLLTSASSHLKHSNNSLFLLLGKIWPLLQTLANTFGVNQVPGRDLLGMVCQYKMFETICRDLSNYAIGYTDTEGTDLEIFTKLFQIYPTRSALKQLIHYLQIYNSGIFREFDHGQRENLKIYGSDEPPEYNLRNVTAPVAYFWGENDCWSRPKDIKDIEKKLPNLVLSYEVPHKLFNHYGIFSARNAKTLIYDKIIETMKGFNSLIDER